MKDSDSSHLRLVVSEAPASHAADLLEDISISEVRAAWLRRMGGGCLAAVDTSKLEYKLDRSFVIVLESLTENRDLDIYADGQVLSMKFLLDFHSIKERVIAANFVFCVMDQLEVGREGLLGLDFSPDAY